MMIGLMTVRERSQSDPHVSSLGREVCSPAAPATSVIVFLSRWATSRTSSTRSAACSKTRGPVWALPSVTSISGAAALSSSQHVQCPVLEMLSRSL